MHPLIARFLDPKAAHAVLARPDPAALDAPDRLFHQAANAHPDLKTMVEAARGLAKPTEEASNALILLGVQAAVMSLRDDPKLADVVKLAADALKGHGATPEQIDQLLAGALVEEAFGSDADPTDYDVEFVRETVATLPALAALEPEKVSELSDAFVEATAKPNRPLSLKAIEALLQSAWGDGPQPVSSEAVLDALDSLDAGSSRAPSAAAMEAAVRFLMAHRLVGPLRLERLLEAVGQWARGESADDSDDDEDDDDEV